jgi:hypothetical protein
MTKSSPLIIFFAVLLTVGVMILMDISFLQANRSDIFIDNFKAGPNVRADDKLKEVVKRVLSDRSQKTGSPELKIIHPFDNAVFPRDIASLQFIWQDSHPDSTLWLLAMDLPGGGPNIYVVGDRQDWLPEKSDWEVIKRYTWEAPAVINIWGLNGNAGFNINTQKRVTISTAKDEVKDSLLFVQSPLPAAFAKDNPEKIKWRLAHLSSYDRPKTVLEGVDTCGNCHKLPSEFRFGTGLKPFGRFPMTSPNGEYEVASVKVKSLTAFLEDITISEFVYHATGIIGFYTQKDNDFHPLPGADNPDYVHTHPAWSPDGEHIVFARARVNHQVYDMWMDEVSVKVDAHTRIADLNAKFPIQYDIYRVPFNNGKGGRAEPVKGASHNGMSNSFPRYSPDGKWIVFTLSKTGFVLQPSSRLFIVPSVGGKAREMNCNTDFYNSYHNWSSNSRWLIFTSKINTPYTELFLTHVDENGVDAPPVLLTRLNTDGLAAVVPEFIRDSPKIPD